MYISDDNIIRAYKPIFQTFIANCAWNSERYEPLLPMFLHLLQERNMFRKETTY